MHITPHIVARNLVSLEIPLAAGSGKSVQLYAVQSGETLVLTPRNAQKSRTEILSGISRLPDTLPDSEEFLVFITPTILAKAPAYNRSKTLAVVDMLNVNLADALHFIEQESSIQCEIRESNEPYSPVNIRLTDIPINIAFREIVASAAAKYSRDVRGVYVIRPEHDYTFP